ncbi:hypothetical protein FDP41_005555 [Naegleria fowleri]|uniref:DJ-1/PfpI domain-containing protein n=1 Tax=Naegleria fowleri TaxID=5763 RepID=A0A6A5BMM5_NAEFO|nr:uncharacterized protein FDP41_005555 [Naegleria fowleri]KAF0975561.1 hypothetical protein FDP41_005555 [Naegleria fowleri]CAG4708338.1 unnamed protein product [Naegleria fowleri]
MFRRASTLITKSLCNTSFAKQGSSFLLFSHQPQYRNYAAQTTPTEKGSVAVLLSGCGYLDGTEITEAVSVMIQLSKMGYKIAFFAPDINQEETYDHLSKTLDKNEVRNIRSEASRITRQNVLKLEQYRPQSFEALFIPGGFGVAKNLSNYAESPSNFKIHPEVEKAIVSTHEAKIPIGMCCIAPILAAKLIPKCSITLGDSDPATTENARALGATCLPKAANQVVVDKDNKLVTTPAYMGKNPTPYEVFDGIVSMVDSVIELTGSKSDEEGEIDFGVLEEIAAKKVGKEQFTKMKEQLYGKKTASK